jgi:hypothetical protein
VIRNIAILANSIGDRNSTGLTTVRAAHRTSGGKSAHVQDCGHRYKHRPLTITSIKVDRANQRLSINARNKPDSSAPSG